VRAVVTRPGAGRAWLADIPRPTIQRHDEVLVQMLRVGVCGTDRHVIARAISATRGLPDGDDYLVLGHEAVGRVVEVGPMVSSVGVGDLVVPTVRRGCDECAACAVGQADLCFTGNVRERGIVGLHGFLTELIVEQQDHLIRVPEELAEVAPLVESLCTPEKALRRIGNARAHLPMNGAVPGGVARALVTGSGPIAILAVLALRLRGVATWMLARRPATSAAARVAETCGATYVCLSDVDLEAPQASIGAFDAIIEATGAAELAVAMLSALAPNGVLDLVGGSQERKAVPVHASVLAAMMVRNLTLLGSVNANSADWQAAVADLGDMRRQFPGAVEAIITDVLSMRDVDVAFERTPDRIKVVIVVDGGA